MENPNSRRNTRGGIEENTLAILDASEAKDTQDSIDDRIAFLEAVRTSSIVSENGTPPTYKMYDAVFQILRFRKSLELIMSSYQLLNELEKNFPRVYITKSGTSPELTVIQEAWTPSVFSLHISSSDSAMAENVSRGPLSPSDFQLLIQDLAEMADEANFKTLDTKSLRNMLLFQYLVNVLEGDFLPRNSMYGETMNWIIVRESLLNTALSSRKLNYKDLMKYCLTIICGLGEMHAGDSKAFRCSGSSDAKPSVTCDTAVEIALPEVGKTTCIAMQRLLIMVMELDSSKKKADMLGHTTRADAVRNTLVEIILDELTYNKDLLSPFLQVFKDPKWKLELVVQYFWKYISKPSVRTRRSNGSTDDATFFGALKCLSNGTTTKSIVKKIGAEVLQLLLAHGFQAFLFLSSEQHLVESPSDSVEQATDSSLVETCKNLVSAFNCLRKTDEHMEILSYAQEAIFAAGTILSTKS